MQWKYLVENAVVPTFAFNNDDQLIFQSRIVRRNKHLVLDTTGKWPTKH